MTDSPTKPDVERFEGCLVGLAVGDALGMPTEGLSRYEIRARWGRVADFAASEDLAAGQFTDDTQTAIALCEAIVNGGGFDAEAAAGALSDWYTSGKARRPGAGTIEACERLRRGVPWREAGSRSAGCGPAPRTVPIGLLHCRNRDRIADDAASSALITHRDPRAVAGAVTMGAAVAHLVSGGAFDIAVFLDQTAAAAAPNSPEMAAAIRGIPQLLDLAPRAAMEELGYSGLALEAVPAAVYCFAAAPDDFAECVLLAVNTGGDSDSIAAMAGALSGAYMGLQGIPSRWVEAVEESQRLRQLAHELHALA